jgi:hypothetical protein
MNKESVLAHKAATPTVRVKEFWLCSNVCQCSISTSYKRSDRKQERESYIHWNVVIEYFRNTDWTAKPARDILCAFIEFHIIQRSAVCP